MINLGSWMNKVLTGWGVDEKIANTFDEAIIAILLVAVAIGLDYLCQAIFVGGVRSIVKHTHYKGSPDKPGGLSIQLCKSEKKEFYIRYSS